MKGRSYRLLVPAVCPEDRTRCLLAADAVTEVEVLRYTGDGVFDSAAEAGPGLGCGHGEWD